MATTAFNPTQRVLLQMFANDNSEERAAEIKEVLTQHFSKQVDDCFNELWESGKLDELRGKHLRTYLRK